MDLIQPLQELNDFYSVADPWNYQGTPDDTRRLAELRSLLPQRMFSSALDIGCGNGFVTVTLPASTIVGIDVSEAAIGWAQRRVASRSSANSISFLTLSIFELDQLPQAGFDLVCITGVLYPQYIGKAHALVSLMVDHVLAPSGMLACCHIDDWYKSRLPYTLVDQSVYSYREYTHRLEVMVK
ncbi:class I SAM-dependent methyltransferase [Rhodoplanes sp. SY1]|uniref:class I SAM-dependent methyltransferase n=1 Tax=Rhodoplanes sp. SY1 TaxID=3166646 RepID=UPI0038B5551C